MFSRRERESIDQLAAVEDELQREQDVDRIVADLDAEAHRWRVAGRKGMMNMRAMIEQGREPCTDGLLAVAKFYEQCDQVARRLQGEASALRLGDLRPNEAVEHKWVRGE